MRSFPLSRTDALLCTLGLLALTACGSESTAPPTPGSLTLASGDGQSGTVGAALTTPLVVSVKDTKGAALSGVSVAWTVTSGGGSVSAASTPTAADGTASVTWMLGGTVGAQSVTAKLSTFTVTFSATAAAGPVAQVTVTPATGTLTALTATLQLSAAPKDSYGNAVQGTVTWSSSNTAILTVSNTGLVTAVANGTADAVATSGSVTGKATLTVAQAVASVDVSPEAPSVMVGSTVQLNAALTDAQGFAVQGGKATWTSRDTLVATVDTTGNVTGQAEGTARVVATSGTVSDSVTVTVTPAAFEPDADTQISDTLNVESVNIPAGVTVTLTGDAVVNATGSITIAGTVTGDCKAATLTAGDTLKVTGTIQNTCSDAEAAGQDLTLGGTVITLTGATLTSGGGITIGDTAAASAAPSRAPGPARIDEIPEFCDLSGTKLTSGGDRGYFYSSQLKIQCYGVVLSGTTLRTADGRDGKSIEAAEDAVGTSGTGGGDVEILTQALSVDGTDGPNTITTGSGGNGGDATATGWDPTAKGGQGAMAGSVFLRSILNGGPDPTSRISDLEIVLGHAGHGGTATAIADDGEDAGASASTRGRSATAFGGKGGDSGRVSSEFDPFVKASSGGAGNGGDARARGGNGGDGNTAFPDGAAGGFVEALGGEAGRLWFNAGNHGTGGDAILEQGNGGVGASSSTAAGGNGGAGGDGSGTPGSSPSGSSYYGKQILRTVGNGGAGGHGLTAGGGGAAGTDGGTPSGFTREVQSGPNFTPGAAGVYRWQDATLGAVLTVLLDPAGHEPFVGMTGVTQVTTSFNPPSFVAPFGGDGPFSAATIGTLTVTGNGNWITVSGDLNDDGTFTATGSGTAAGRSNVSTRLQGTMTRDATGRLTGMTGTLTVGVNGELNGTPVSYTVTAGS